MKKDNDWVDRPIPESWMVPDNKRDTLLRNLAIINDHIHGMTQGELAKKYFVTRGRIWQLVGSSNGWQDFRLRRYYKMRREQLAMLNEYPAIWKEITGDRGE